MCIYTPVVLHKPFLFVLIYSGLDLGDSLQAEMLILTLFTLNSAPINEKVLDIGYFRRT